MSGVMEYIVDGTSGLIPEGVTGVMMMAGVCSSGTPGKAYLIGKSTRVEDVLGVGPLTTRLRDCLRTAGQSPVVIAVPVEGLTGSLISPVAHAGTGPDASASGGPQANADVVVEITTSGAPGTAQARISEDGGGTFGSAASVPASGQVTIGTTGVTLVLGAGDLILGDTYAFVIRAAIGPVSHVGTGPDLTITGAPLAAADVILQVVKGGGRNDATYILSVDGGDAFTPARTNPVDGQISVGDTGVTITTPAQDLVAGDEYRFQTLAPTASISSVMSALEIPLETYIPEFVQIVGPSDSTDWAASAAKAEELFNSHRGTFFVMEQRTPYPGEDLSDWATSLLQERSGFASMYVTVVAQHGEVSDSTGYRQHRNWAGLLSGRISNDPVMRSVGRIRSGPITGVSLPEGWNDTIQTVLQEAGYVTAKTYAGLNGVYWDDAKTLADVVSDFLYLRPLRVTLKALRLARIAALKSIYDELGDPVREETPSGLGYLKANLAAALRTMTRAYPKELSDFVIEIPAGQDYVNNGVAVEITLIGIPVIGTIKLYTRYINAGSMFDPRVENIEYGLAA